MFDEPLPKQADLRKLASKEVKFSVCLNVADFSRLADALYEGLGLIYANLHLGVNDEGVRYIQGDVNCVAKVVCQRCMEPVDINFGSEVNLGIVHNEQVANELPRALDPLIVSFDQLVDLNEVIEDELLLSLPYVSYHDSTFCGGEKQYESQAKEVIPLVKKENPFSVLVELKTSK